MNNKEHEKIVDAIIDMFNEAARDEDDNFVLSQRDRTWLSDQLWEVYNKGALEGSGHN